MWSAISPSRPFTVSSFAISFLNSASSAAGTARALNDSISSSTLAMPARMTAALSCRSRAVFSPLGDCRVEFLQFRGVRFVSGSADLVGVVRPFGPTRFAFAADRFGARARVRPAADLGPEFPRQRFQPLPVGGDHADHRFEFVRAPRFERFGELLVELRGPFEPADDPDHLRFVCRRRPQRADPLDLGFDARHRAADQLGGFFADLRASSARPPPAPRIRFPARRWLRGRRCRSRRPAKPIRCGSAALRRLRRPRCSSRHRRSRPPARRRPRTRPATTATASASPPRSLPTTLAFQPGEAYGLARPQMRDDPEAADSGSSSSGTGALPHRCGVTPDGGWRHAEPTREDPREAPAARS